MLPSVMSGNPRKATNSEESFVDGGISNSVTSPVKKEIRTVVVLPNGRIEIATQEFLDIRPYRNCSRRSNMFAAQDNHSLVQIDVIPPKIESFTDESPRSVQELKQGAKSEWIQ